MDLLYYINLLVCNPMLLVPTSQKLNIFDMSRDQAVIFHSKTKQQGVFQNVFHIHSPTKRFLVPFLAHVLYIYHHDLHKTVYSLLFCN